MENMSVLLLLAHVHFRKNLSDLIQYDMAVFSSEDNMNVFNYKQRHYSAALFTYQALYPFHPQKLGMLWPICRPFSSRCIGVLNKPRSLLFSPSPVMLIRPFNRLYNPSLYSIGFLQQFTAGYTVQKHADWSPIPHGATPSLISAHTHKSSSKWPPKDCAYRLP